MAQHPILERYLWFDGQIRRGRYPSAADLARHFELCRKTAQRDIRLKVLQFGADVEVLEPPVLREWILEEIERMRELYGEAAEAPRPARRMPSEPVSVLVAAERPAPRL